MFCIENSERDNVGVHFVHSLGGQLFGLEVAVKVFWATVTPVDIT